MLIELTVKEKQNLQMSLRDLEAFYGSLHANTQEEQESFEDILKEIAHLRSRLQDHSNSNKPEQEITKVNQIARTLRLVANVVEEVNLTEEELIVIRVDEIGSVTIMVKEQQEQQGKGKWTIERLGEHFHEPVEYDVLTKDKGYDKYILRVNVGDRRIRFVEMHKGGSKDER